MIRMLGCTPKLLALSALFLAPGAVFAGAASVGALVYAPVGGDAQAVPVLSAPVLLALSALLGLVAFRLLRGRLSGGLSALVSALGTGALVGGMAAGGLWVHSVDAAVPVIELSNPNGGSVDILAVPDGQYYQNTSGVPLQILSITPPLGCIISAVENGVPGCSVGQVLALMEQCSVFVSCDIPE